MYKFDFYNTLESWLVVKTLCDNSLLLLRRFLFFERPNWSWWATRAMEGLKTSNWVQRRSALYSFLGSRKSQCDWSDTTMHLDSILRCITLPVGICVCLRFTHTHTHTPKKNSLVARRLGDRKKPESKNHWIGLLSSSWPLPETLVFVGNGEPRMMFLWQTSEITLLGGFLVRIYQLVYNHPYAVMCWNSTTVKTKQISGQSLRKRCWSIGFIFPQCAGWKLKILNDTTAYTVDSYQLQVGF